MCIRPYLNDIILSFKSYAVNQIKDGLSEGEVVGYCIRRTLWWYSNCKGKLKRQICNLGVEDLHVAVNPECHYSGTGSCFFINKLDLTIDPLSVTCLAQHVLAAKSRSNVACT